MSTLLGSLHTRNELIPLSGDSDSYGIVGANDLAQETIDTLLALNRRYFAPGSIIAEDRLTAYKKTLTAHVAKVVINSRRHHSPSLFVVFVKFEAGYDLILFNPLVHQA